MTWHPPRDLSRMYIKTPEVGTEEAAFFSPFPLQASSLVLLSIMTHLSHFRLSGQGSSPRDGAAATYSRSTSRQVPSAGRYTGTSPLSELSLTAEEGFNLISPASPAMVTEEQYDELLSRFHELQAIVESQARNQPTTAPAPAPVPTPTPAPTLRPKPPKVAPPTPFAGTSEDLDRFKAECGIYFHVRAAEFPDALSQILFVLSYMKGGTAGAWATQRTIALLTAGSPTLTMDEFNTELDAMFQDPNREATARQKLAALRQGSDSVDKIIQEFEILGPASRLGDVGLVDRFEQAINSRLCESIYRLRPMPTTWAEWKREATLLDNQWRRFQATQPHPPPTRPPFPPARPPPTTTFPHARPALAPPRPPAAAAPPVARPAAGAGPQPMDLDRSRTDQRRDGLCYNCNAPGHVARDCPQPRARRVRRMHPEDLRALMEGLKSQLVDGPKAEEGEGQEAEAQEDFQEGDR
jgi:hypothetical protein